MLAKGQGRAAPAEVRSSFPEVPTGFRERREGSASDCGVWFGMRTGLPAAVWTGPSCGRSECSVREQGWERRPRQTQPALSLALQPGHTHSQASSVGRWSTCPLEAHLGALLQGWAPGMSGCTVCFLTCFTQRDLSAEHPSPRGRVWSRLSPGLISSRNTLVLDRPDPAGHTWV